MTNVLYTIVVSKKVGSHPYWRPGAFVALRDADWGPSPVFDQVDVPTVFLTAAAAQAAIDRWAIPNIPFEVVSFKRRA